jgi:hypothetical protein
MLFDSICHVLDVNILNFRGRRADNLVELNWDISNNRDASAFYIEYSFNNRDFNQLVSLQPNNQRDMASYNFTGPWLSNSPPVVYYRIKVTTRDGKIKYSNIIVLKNTDSDKDPFITIYPNPTTGQAWLSIHALNNETVETTTWTAQGKRVNIATIQLQGGENKVKLPDLSMNPSGIYYIKLKFRDKLITRKIYVHR